MKFVQAQFSIKFEPILKIRREANLIEDALGEYYLPPQIISMPDDFAPDAPRIILTSKGGHSQIQFSQYAINIVANFDGDYVNSFDKTKSYLDFRIELLKRILNDLNRDSYYYFGLIYNAHVDTDGMKPSEYMQTLLVNSMKNTEEMYDASLRTAVIDNERFFINKQIGIYREYQGIDNGNMDLMNFSNNKVTDEGINLSVDVNNRYGFLSTGTLIGFDSFDDDLRWIYEKMENSLNQTNSSLI